jgi:hypothetical protein
MTTLILLIALAWLICAGITCCMIACECDEITLLDIFMALLCGPGGVLAWLLSPLLGVVHSITVWRKR